MELTYIFKYFSNNNLSLRSSSSFIFTLEISLLLLMFIIILLILIFLHTINLVPQSTCINLIYIRLQTSEAIITLPNLIIINFHISIIRIFKIRLIIHKAINIANIWFNSPQLYSKSSNSRRTLKFFTTFAAEHIS